MKTRCFLSFLIACSLYACTGNKSSDFDNNSSSEETDSLVLQPSATGNVSDTLIYIWQSDMCEYKGYYVRGKYSENELKATFDLWIRLSSGLNAGVSVFSPADIDEIDLSELTDEYNKLISFIDSSRIVDVPFWREFIDEQKKSLKMQYDLKIMRYKAYSDPSVLLDNPYLDKDSECNNYAKALNSGDAELYAAWEKWAENQKTKNASPERFMQQFYEKYNSPDKKRYAFIDMIGFGWWNCVNHAIIEYPDYSLLADNFQKLFVKVEEFNCEEP